MGIDIRRLSVGDAAMLDTIAPGVFDDPIDGATLGRFLAQENHHLFLARDGEIVVGFLSAMLHEHPDKHAPDFWIDELGVARAYQRHGIGSALLDQALEFARAHGCSEAWVLSDRKNEKAKRLYASRTQEPVIDVQMFTFLLADSSGRD